MAGYVPGASRRGARTPSASKNDWVSPLSRNLAAVAGGVPSRGTGRARVSAPEPARNPSTPCSRAARAARAASSSSVSKRMQASAARDEVEVAEVVDGHHAVPGAARGCGDVPGREAGREQPAGHRSSVGPSASLPCAVGTTRIFALGNVASSSRPSKSRSRKTASPAISEWGWLVTATL